MPTPTSTGRFCRYRYSKTKADTAKAVSARMARATRKAPAQKAVLHGVAVRFLCVAFIMAVSRSLSVFPGSAPDCIYCTFFFSICQSVGCLYFLQISNLFLDGFNKKQISGCNFRFLILQNRHQTVPFSRFLGKFFLS